METYEAIVTRRSAPKTDPERVPSREQIERLLAAGVRAPTHHLTQPWRFVVLAGDALDGLGDAWARADAAAGKDPEAVRGKPHRAPVIITVIEDPHLDNPKVVEVEEHHATGACMQNILLAAHDMRLAAMLRTGPAARLDEVRTYLGLKPTELIAGFIYVGFPAPGADERPMTRRTDIAGCTEWRGM